MFEDIQAQAESLLSAEGLSVDSASSAQLRAAYEQAGASRRGGGADLGKAIDAARVKGQETVLHEGVPVMMCDGAPLAVASGRHLAALSVLKEQGKSFETATAAEYRRAAKLAEEEGLVMASDVRIRLMDCEYLGPLDAVAA